MGVGLEKMGDVSGTTRKKVLITGGVAGGSSCATRLRRLDENAEIIIFERDKYISFANCGLPYYIGGAIKNRRSLLVQTPEMMQARFNIDVRTNSEVIAVDGAAGKVLVKNITGQVYEESYDYLVLSPGGKALKPCIPGIDLDNVFTLRNIPDTDKIKSFIDGNGIKSALIAGGGFIGVEMAENLKKLGLEVTLAEALPHILAPLDDDIAEIAEKELVRNSVNLITSDAIILFEKTRSGIRTSLKSGKKVIADIVILAFGIMPDTAFLKESGIGLGPKGHIKVNKNMETSLAHVYATGDAVEVTDFVTGRITAVPLAGPASKQGRIAADNIAGIASEYNGTQGSFIIKIFSLTAAATGASERKLQNEEIRYKAVSTHSSSHATYYPGGTPITLKLIFDMQGKILGAQGIGREGVDKRIDVIATAIRFGGTVNDLAGLELAYAPPYSSAKDPVNMAGFVAQNVLAGRSHMISWKDAKKYPSSHLLLDVRTKEEYENGHPEGAVNIPVDELRDRLGEISRESTILVYCQVGYRGYIADRILSQRGFNVLNITGGYESYPPAKT